MEHAFALLHLHLIREGGFTDEEVELMCEEKKRLSRISLHAPAKVSISDKD